MKSRSNARVAHENKRSTFCGKARTDAKEGSAVFLVILEKNRASRATAAASRID